MKKTEIPRVGKKTFRENHGKSGNRRIEILFEDEHIIVVIKPEGMLSVPYAGSSKKTVINTLEDIMHKNGAYSSRHKPYAVHRLDRDTSGVMMFALNETAQRKIMNNWNTMVTERLYRAVAENPARRPLPDTGTIDSPLSYNKYNIGFVPASKNGQSGAKIVPAVTRYKVIARGKTHTLFELSLETGRKNQIRAHLASKGYPLSGDKAYRAKTNPFGRLMLHARTLRFYHPFTNELMTFESPEPEEWMAFVTKRS